MADSIGPRIKKARDDAGYTQEQFAPLLGVSLRTLTRYESGETQRISAQTLVRIASLTNKRLSFFIGKAVAA